MPSPFPGMDPYLETNPIFQELHTQMLAEMQALLQPQLRPRYVARLERHLSEGTVWDAPQGAISLERKEPDITIARRSSARKQAGSTAVLARPALSVGEELDEDELELRKQRRIVIYVQDRPRLAVTGIELLSQTADSRRRSRFGRLPHLRGSGDAYGLEPSPLSLPAARPPAALADSAFGRGPGRARPRRLLCRGLRSHRRGR
jgi:hypothetical protein